MFNLNRHQRDARASRGISMRIFYSLKQIKMNHYQIDLNPEPKIIGVNNGIFQIEIDKNEILNNDVFKEFRECFNYNNKGFWKDQNNVFGLKIPAIRAKLLKKAKITDIMGYTPNITFLKDVLSSKYIGILNQFNINKYKIFEVEIENLDEKYYLFYPLTIVLEDINYERSLIYTGHKIMKNVKYYSINTYKEYREFKTLNPIHSFEKISISKEYENLDLISIQGTGRNFYSERLIEGLLKNQITGLQISYNNSIQLDFY